VTGVLHIAVVMKPLEGNFAQNALKHGVAGLNIDGCRIGTEESLNGGAYAKNGAGRRPLIGDGRDGASLGMFQHGKTTKNNFTQPQGRWPANVILCHSDCKITGTRKIKSPIRKPTGKPIYNTEGKPVGWNDNKVMDTTVRTHADADGMETVQDWECVDGCPVKKLGEQSGMLTSGVGCVRTKPGGGYPGNIGKAGDVQTSYGDTGTASRFFFQVKEFKEET
jgi:hypothetical protein